MYMALIYNINIIQINYTYYTNFSLFQIGPKDYEDNEVFQKIRDDRGYNYKDIISVSTDTLPDYEKKVLY